MKLKSKLISNFGGLASINIINILIPLIMMPFLSRTIGSDSYGVFFIFTTTISFAVIVMDYSVNITGVRDIAASNESEKQIIFTKNQSVRLVMGVFSVFACSFYIYIFADGYSSQLIFVLLVHFIAISGCYMSTPWFFHGMSDMKITAFSTISTRLIQLLFVISAVKSSVDLNVLILSNSIAFFAAGFISAIYRKKRYQLKNTFSARAAKNGLTDGFNAFIGDFAPNLYSNIPQLVVGAIVSPSVFSAYSIAMRLVNIAGSFQVIICKSFYPLISVGSFTLKRLLIINFSLSIISFLFIYMFGQQLITLIFGSEMHQAYRYLLPLSVSMIFAGILWSFSYGYFLPSGLDKNFRNISISVSLVSSVSGYFLIKNYGAMGAVSMFVLARFLFASVYTYRFLRK